MLHARVGGALTALAVSAHAYYVWHERVDRAPSGRYLSFSPGSQDASVADTLRTGDIVLFARDCSLSAGAAGLRCVARRARGGASGGPADFDGAGVIVLKAGVPFVLEGGSSSSPRLTRYEARIQASRARKIVVRPMRPPLNGDAAAALAAHASAVAGRPAAGLNVGADNASAFFSISAFARNIAEAAALTIGVPGSHSAVAAVLAATKAAGLDSGVSTMSDLAPPSQPFSPARLGAPVWVRDLR